MFAFNGGADGVAKIDLGYVLIWTRKDGAKFTFTLDFCQLLHVLHVLFVRFGAPKDNAKLNPVRFLECEYQSAVGKVAPFVIWPD